MSASSAYRVFAILLVISVALWWHAIAATAALALRQDAYTHILLVLPVSLTLILLKNNNRKWRPNPNLIGGIVMLILAALVGIVAPRFVSGQSVVTSARLSLQMVGLVAWWIGSFLLCFGRDAFRACMFPLLFLFWLVPVPDAVLNFLIVHLQQGSATTARVLFNIAGIPVKQDGTTLAIPGLSIEVAEECSSIRSSMMLVISSMVLSYLLLRSLWGRALVMIAAVPLSIAKNGLRVFVLSTLGAYVNRGVLDSPLHHQGGVLFLAVALAVIVLLIWIVGWAERKTLSLALR